MKQDVQKMKEMAMLAALKEVNQKRQEEMNRQKETEKDLVHVEIRNKGRISMFYLKKETVELWEKIMKENPELSQMQALGQAFVIMKEKEKQ